MTYRETVLEMLDKVNWMAYTIRENGSTDVESVDELLRECGTASNRLYQAYQDIHGCSHSNCTELRKCRTCKLGADYCRRGEIGELYFCDWVTEMDSDIPVDTWTCLLYLRVMAESISRLL